MANKDRKLLIQRNLLGEVLAMQAKRLILADDYAGLCELISLIQSKGGAWEALIKATGDDSLWRIAKAHAGVYLFSNPDCLKIVK